MRRLRDCLDDAYMEILKAAWERDGLAPGEPWPPADGSLSFERVAEDGWPRSGAAEGREAS